MIYLPKIYQVILFKGKYKHILLNSLVSFCLLRLFNLSIHHTFTVHPCSTRNYTLASKILSWPELTLLFTLHEVQVLMVSQL